MKKKLIFRGVFGIPIGIAIGYIITIIISLVWADGYYTPCVPELIVVMGNEVNAVSLQALLCGMLGAGFGAASVIWEVEEWGIMKQTGIYFLVVSVIMMPIAYITYWMEHSVIGFISYFGIFGFIFFGIWLIQFLIGKSNVKKMNENLRNSKGNTDVKKQKKE